MYVCLSISLSVCLSHSVEYNIKLNQSINQSIKGNLNQLFNHVCLSVCMFISLYIHAHTIIVFLFKINMFTWQDVTTSEVFFLSVSFSFFLSYTLLQLCTPFIVSSISFPTLRARVRIPTTQFSSFVFPGYYLKKNFGTIYIYLKNLFWNNLYFKHETSLKQTNK